MTTEATAFDYRALWECKSANAKNWRDIVKRGVTLAKPVYAAQIALYQAYMGLPGDILMRETRGRRRTTSTCVKDVKDCRPCWRPHVREHLGSLAEVRVEFR